MNNCTIDVAVLILFFANPNRLVRVFEQVKKARPRVLFLYQDGPRIGKNDLEGILKCREIVNDIDWECEIYRWYQSENIGCDPSEFISQKWAFSYVDKCIILEDDDVPSVSFFHFCKELLDKYESDERISMIAGMNHEEVTKGIPYDYFFTSNVSIWGWATWKRVVDNWDSKYDFMKDPYIVQSLQRKIKNICYRKDFFPMLSWHSKSGIEYYESIHMAYMLLNSGLSIVPTKNMILNIGYSGGTHSDYDLDELSKYEKKLYTLKTYEIGNDIKHPPFIMEEYEYKKRVYKMMGWNLSFVKKVQKKIRNLIVKVFFEYKNNKKLC
jgi:hypothetical protein